MTSGTWHQIATQKITVDPEKCIGCGNCEKACPFMVFELQRGEKGGKIAVAVYQEDCFICQSCQAQCPVDAIAIEW